VTTSGSVSYNLSANQFIEKAFHRLGKASEGEAMTPRMYEDGRSSLNLILKAIGAEEHLFTKQERTLALVASTAAYVLTPKPLRVLSIRRRQDAIDVPMNEMARQDYFDQPNKTGSPSIPVSWYYDPQTTTGTLYVWPAPSTQAAADVTLQITQLRRIEDILASNDDLDVPQEWQHGLIWILANDLETEYPVNDARLAKKIGDQAGFWWSRAQSFDTEPASIYLQPEMLEWRA
jgi:hypothetical protein